MSATTAQPADTTPGLVTRVRAWWADSPRRWSASTLWMLAWLATFAFQPAFDAENRTRLIVVGALASAVFVLIYLAAELRDGPVRRWSIELTTGLAVLVLATGTSGGGVLLVYAAAFAGGGYSRRVALGWLAGLTAVLAVAAAIGSVEGPWWVPAYLPSAILIWVIGLLTIESNAEAVAADQRAAAAEQLAMAAERERISRDLHDVLGHSLTAVVVQAQLARRLVERDPVAGAAVLLEIETAARTALAEVRATVAGYRRTDLDTEFAAAAVTLRAAGIATELHREPHLALEPAGEAALALALREAVTNVVRHAGAGRAGITVRADGDRIRLEVVDDGVGSADSTEGNGLTGMRERIGSLGGAIHRDTGAGPRCGTTLVATLPAATR